MEKVPCSFGPFGDSCVHRERAEIFNYVVHKGKTIRSTYFRLRSDSFTYDHRTLKTSSPAGPAVRQGTVLRFLCRVYGIQEPVCLTNTTTIAS
jgi:hypothetical protein